MLSHLHGTFPVIAVTSLPQKWSTVNCRVAALTHLTMKDLQRIIRGRTIGDTKHPLNTQQFALRSVRGVDLG